MTIGRVAYHQGLIRAISRPNKGLLTKPNIEYCPIVRRPRLYPGESRAVSNLNTGKKLCLKALQPGRDRFLHEGRCNTSQLVEPDVVFPSSKMCDIDPQKPQVPRRESAFKSESGANPTQSRSSASHGVRRIGLVYMKLVHVNPGSIPGSGCDPWRGAPMQTVDGPA